VAGVVDAVFQIRCCLVAGVVDAVFQIRRCLVAGVVDAVNNGAAGILANTVSPGTVQFRSVEIRPIDLARLASQRLQRITRPPACRKDRPPACPKDRPVIPTQGGGARDPGVL